MQNTLERSFSRCSSSPARAAQSVIIAGGSGKGRDAEGVSVAEEKRRPDDDGKDKPPGANLADLQALASRRDGGEGCVGGRRREGWPGIGKSTSALGVDAARAQERQHQH